MKNHSMTWELQHAQRGGWQLVISNLKMALLHHLIVKSLEEELRINNYNKGKDQPQTIQPIVA